MQLSLASHAVVNRALKYVDTTGFCNRCSSDYEYVTVTAIEFLSVRLGAGAVSSAGGLPPAQSCVSARATDATKSGDTSFFIMDCSRASSLSHASSWGGAEVSVARLLRSAQKFMKSLAACSAYPIRAAFVPACGNCVFR